MNKWLRRAAGLAAMALLLGGCTLKTVTLDHRNGQAGEAVLRMPDSIVLSETEIVGNAVVTIRPHGQQAVTIERSTGSTAVEMVFTDDEITTWNRLYDAIEDFSNVTDSYDDLEGQWYADVTVTVSGKSYTFPLNRTEDDAIDEYVSRWNDLAEDTFSTVYYQGHAYTPITEYEVIDESGVRKQATYLDGTVTWVTPLDEEERFLQPADIGHGEL